MSKPKTKKEEKEIIEDEVKAENSALNEEEELDNESELEADEIDEEETKSSVKSITILNAKNKPLRTYSLAVHGKDFKALAKQYVEGHPGSHI